MNNEYRFEFRVPKYLGGITTVKRKIPTLKFKSVSQHLANDPIEYFIKSKEEFYVNLVVEQLDDKSIEISASYAHASSRGIRLLTLPAKSHHINNLTKENAKTIAKFALIFNGYA